MPSGCSFHIRSVGHRSPTARQPIKDQLLDYIPRNSIKREEHMTRGESSDQKYICLKKPSVVLSMVDFLQFRKQHNTYYKFHFMLLRLLLSLFLPVYSCVKQRDNWSLPISNKSSHIMTKHALCQYFPKAPFQKLLLLLFLACKCRG